MPAPKKKLKPLLDQIQAALKALEAKGHHRSLAVKKLKKKLKAFVGVCHEASVVSMKKK